MKSTRARVLVLVDCIPIVARSHVEIAFQDSAAVHQVLDERCLRSVRSVAFLRPSEACWAPFEQRECGIDRFKIGGGIYDAAGKRAGVGIQCFMPRA